MKEVKFENKVWSITVEQGVVYVYNKSKDCTSVLKALTDVKTYLGGVVTPKYIYDILAGIFEDLAAIKMEQAAEFMAQDVEAMMEKLKQRKAQIEKELKPYPVYDYVKEYAANAALNQELLIRAIKKPRKPQYIGRTETTYNHCTVTNEYGQHVFAQFREYSLEYIDKVTDRIYVMSDMFYRGEYNGLLMFKRNSSYFVLRAEQVKFSIQQKQTIGGLV